MSLRHRLATVAALALSVPVLLVPTAGAAAAASSSGSSSASSSGGSAVDCVGPEALSSRTFTIQRSGGRASAPQQTLQGVQAGDRVTATVVAAPGCKGTRVGLASYRSDEAPGAGVTKTQPLFDSSSVVLDGKRQTLVVVVPRTLGSASAGGCTNKHQGADPGKGANGSGQYGNSCDGSAAQNGRGGGGAEGRPCAGCVGNADDKNPPGQAPNGSDRNAGYECDRNQGVGQSNPAHTSCAKQYFQIDLFTGNVLRQVVPEYYLDRLIWGHNG